MDPARGGHGRRHGLPLRRPGHDGPSSRPGTAGTGRRRLPAGPGLRPGPGHRHGRPADGVRPGPAARLPPGAGPGGRGGWAAADIRRLAAGDPAGLLLGRFPGGHGKGGRQHGADVDGQSGQPRVRPAAGAGDLRPARPGRGGRGLGHLRRAHVPGRDPPGLHPAHEGRAVAGPVRPHQRRAGRSGGTAAARLWGGGVAVGGVGRLLGHESRGRRHRRPDRGRLGGGAELHRHRLHDPAGHVGRQRRARRTGVWRAR